MKYRFFLYTYLVFTFAVIFPSNLHIGIFSKGNFLGNFYFKIAETYKDNNDFIYAADFYLKAYEKYNNHKNKSDTLLNLGIMLVKIGEKTEGCKIITGIQIMDPKPRLDIIKQSYKYQFSLNCKLDYYLDEDIKLLAQLKSQML